MLPPLSPGPSGELEAYLRISWLFAAAGFAPAVLLLVIYVSMRKARKREAEQLLMSAEAIAGRATFAAGCQNREDGPRMVLFISDEGPGLSAESEAAPGTVLAGGTWIDSEAERPPKTPGGPLAALTKREAQILSLIKDGLSFREIARRLGIKPHTVQNTAACIKEKLYIKKFKDLETR